MQEQFADASVKKMRVIAMLTPISSLGHFLPQFLLVIVGGLIINGSFTIGQLTIFFFREQSVKIFPAVRMMFQTGGQRRRISVARAICKKELKLLLLDEATSALAQTTEADLVSAVTNLKKRPALLMIKHKLANIKNVDNRLE